MTLEEFRKLKAGDKIHHPKTGTVEVKHIYVGHFWDDDGNYSQGTWALEASNGGYLKEHDADVKLIRKVK